jgi:hypothetical protein
MNNLSLASFLRPLGLSIAPLLLSVPLPALALGLHAKVSVTIDGQDYTVTSGNFSFDSNSSMFATPPTGSMPWWQSESLAIAFASAVGTSLGLPNQNPGNGVFEGPTFAYGIGSFGLGSFGVDVMNFVPLAANCCVVTRGQFFSSVSNYAFVTTQAPLEVPGPLPILGATFAFGLSRQLRRRIRS